MSVAGRLQGVFRAAHDRDRAAVDKFGGPSIFRHGGFRIAAEGFADDFPALSARILAAETGDPRGDERRPRHADRFFAVYATPNRDHATPDSADLDGCERFVAELAADASFGDAVGGSAPQTPGPSGPTRRDADLQAETIRVLRTLVQFSAGLPTVARILADLHDAGRAGGLCHHPDFAELARFAVRVRLEGGNWRPDEAKCAKALFDEFSPTAIDWAAGRPARVIADGRNCCGLDIAWAIKVGAARVAATEARRALAILETEAAAAPDGFARDLVALVRKFGAAAVFTCGGLPADARARAEAAVADLEAALRPAAP